MNVHTINGADYYRLDDIIASYPNFNNGCHSGVDVLKKYNFDAKSYDYIYDRSLNNIWVVTNGKSRNFDKIFLDKYLFDEMFCDDTIKDYTENTTSLKSYLIEKNNYYKLDDITTMYKNFSKGCKSPIGIIKKYKLDSEYNIKKKNFIYARFVNDLWTISNGKNKKLDKILIRKKWLSDNFTDEQLLQLKDNTQIAPPIINLNDDEKFYDDDDKVIEIEVSAGFKMPNLQKNMIDKKTKYKEHKHYEYFYSEKDHKMSNDGSRKLYLTYRGVIRVLMVSQNETVEKFADWACDVLFTAQMGSIAQKIKLASSLTGIDYHTITNMLKTTSDVSCLYLINIGLVKDLRTKYNIDITVDDNSYVAKFGRTNSLSRRLREHRAKYGNDIELLIFEYIDNMLLVEAESSLKTYFTSVKTRIITDGTCNPSGQAEDELIIVTRVIST